MARCALEAQIAIQRQKPDRERFWVNTDIALAEDDPIFRSGLFERLELDEGLPQIFGHGDFTAASLALGCPIDEMDGVGDGASSHSRLPVRSRTSSPRRCTLSRGRLVFVISEASA